VDVRIAATLAMPGEVLAELHCGFDMPEHSLLEVIGSEGRITVDDPWHCRQPGFQISRGSAVETIQIQAADSYQLELEDLARAIQGEGAPLLGRDDAMGQARTIAAVLQSASR
jgi:predicted dehydrogenase